MKTVSSSFLEQSWKLPSIWCHIMFLMPRESASSYLKFCVIYMHQSHFFLLFFFFLILMQFLSNLLRHLKHDSVHSSVQINYNNQWKERTLSFPVIVDILLLDTILFGQILSKGKNKKSKREGRKKICSISVAHIKSFAPFPFLL